MKTTNNLKVHLFELCQNAVDLRLQAVETKIKDIQESLASETKSSAGDKHETGRAMLQLEREKAGQQLAQIEKSNRILSQIKRIKPSKNIGLGSLVLTTNANYYIAVSVGELHVNETTYYAISADTPMGQLLLGKSTGDNINFRSNTFKITEVL
ncbi:MAG: 3-oxoacyl-ACP synthase [Algicola sp.]|nr:3-oxoacyl-ACP synthase [Algicola sp.]